MAIFTRKMTAEEIHAAQAEKKERGSVRASPSRPATAARAPSSTSEIDPRAELRAAIAKAGSANAWSKTNRISAAAISRALNDGPIAPGLLKALGLAERVVTVYERI